jgi:tRNA(fMet)-specific endonuclease VapC
MGLKTFVDQVGLRWKLDLLIAAHALALNATSVSNNLREFQRVEDLALENWLDDQG